MSPERSEVQKDYSLFPLSKQSVQGAIYWMKENIPQHSQRPGEMSRLQAEKFKVFSFVTGMSIFRDTIQFDKPQVTPYENGALFMLNVIQNEYDKRGKELIEPNTDIIKTYFMDLLDIENNHYEVDRVDSGYEGGLDATDASLAPFSREIIEQTGTPEGKRLRKTFIKNSMHRREDLLNNERFVTEVLVNGTFLKAYGPYEGLHYGALDIYGIYKLQEERSGLRRMWNRKVK